MFNEEAELTNVKSANETTGVHAPGVVPDVPPTQVGFIIVDTEYPTSGTTFTLHPYGNGQDDKTVVQLGAEAGGVGVTVGTVGAVVPANVTTPLLDALKSGLLSVVG
jgi:hypothetical protein